MGYEIRLYVGWETSAGDEHKRKTKPIIEDNSLYFPLDEDENGELIPTGRVETHFLPTAMVDLAKPGYESEICKLAGEVEKRAKKMGQKVVKLCQGNEEEEETSESKEVVSQSTYSVLLPARFGSSAID